MGQLRRSWGTNQTPSVCADVSEMRGWKPGWSQDSTTETRSSSPVSSWIFNLPHRSHSLFEICKYIPYFDTPHPSTPPLTDIEPFSSLAARAKFGTPHDGARPYPVPRERIGNPDCAGLWIVRYSTSRNWCDHLHSSIDSQTLMLRDTHLYLE